LKASGLFAALFATTALLGLGCASRAATGPTDTTPRSAPVTSPAPAPVPCPRVERAARISTGYAGWARDIPSEDMVLALEVVVPIQERLGALFCAAELAACRPLQLLGIELADARPSSALVRLQGVAHAPDRELQLRLWWSNQTWQPDAASLDAYLAGCREAQSR
jgi:hypothetical protein